MFNLFKSKISAAPRIITELLPPGTIGAGKWVVANQQIGILASVTGYPVVEVHIVNDLGETTKVVQTHMDQIRIARYLEIPESRRPVDVAYAAAILGYV